MKCIHLLTDWWAIKDTKKEDSFFLSGKSLTSEVLQSTDIIGIIKNGETIYVSSKNIGYMLDKPASQFIKQISSQSLSVDLLMKSIEITLQKLTWESDEINNMKGKDKLEPFKKGQVVFLNDRKVAFKEYVQEFGKCSVVFLESREEVIVPIDELNRHPPKEGMSEV